MSTTEVEYIAVGSRCSQLIWMKQVLKEYNVKQDVMTLYCNNLSAINIFKNPIQHSRKKHIDIRHHFIMDLVEDKIVTLEHVATQNQLTNIFTKALDANQFEKLRDELGICMFEELYQLLMWRRAINIFSSLHLVVHETPSKSLQTFLIFILTLHNISLTYSIDSILSTFSKLFIIILAYFHLSIVNLNSKSVIKMSKPSGLTPRKSTIGQSPRGLHVLMWIIQML